MTSSTSAAIVPNNHPAIDPRWIELGDRRIGPSEPVYIIAEAGVNHDGDPRAAVQLVDAAAEAGADAVKFQTFSAAELTTSNVEQADYQRRNLARGGETDKDDSQREMLRRLELPRSIYPVLIERAKARGIQFLSTAFDLNSATFLAELGMPGFKTSSGELTNIPFLLQLAKFQLPLIVSTGMGSMEEVDRVTEALHAGAGTSFALMHCTTTYPTQPDDVNLRAIAALRKRFEEPVGYSDHTKGTFATVGAVALGACILEKHFTLSHDRVGPDHAASLEPHELRAWVQAARETERMLGDGEKKPTESEKPVRALVRRFLCAARPLRAGHVLTNNDLVAKRCPGSILPGECENLIGKRLAHDLRMEQPLTPEDFQQSIPLSPRS